MLVDSIRLRSAASSRPLHRYATSSARLLPRVPASLRIRSRLVLVQSIVRHLRSMRIVARTV